MSSNLGVKALETKIEDYVESVLPQATIDIVNDFALQADSIEAQGNQTADIVSRLYEGQFSDFAVATYETAPYTTIQNRAQVSNTLKPMAGIERVRIDGLSRLENEFGTTGLVYQPVSKDSRIRFNGMGWREISINYGMYAQTNVINDFVEISFYGTGLQLLSPYLAVLPDVRLSLDGGAEGTNIFTTVVSDILGARGYNPNIIWPLASGLSLGWHTIKLRLNTAVNFYVSGFQILNSRSDLAIYPGTGVSSTGTKTLAALATSSFNDGVVGTRGARVIKYLNNGTIGSAVTEVDATTKYLTLADHTNEEVLRKINFREFGVNTANDFNTLSTTNSDRYFTLDDGTTTLVGNDVLTDATTIEGVVLATNSSSSLTITFVGTGLDVFWSSQGSGTNSTPNAFEVFVDGISIGNWTTTSSTQLSKVVSGLQFGTHTVKFFRNVPNVWSLKIAHFVIYQPKKPSIPAGAFEVAEYCVPANYSNPALTVSGSIPTGVIRKMNSREMLPFGTWAAAVNMATPSGVAITSSTAGSYVEFRFWGTGFNYRFGNNAGAQSFTVSVNGSTNLSALTTALYANAGLLLASGTGTVSGSPAISTAENNLSVTGLALGFHTVRVSWISGALISPNALDIVTPIYFQPSTHKIGSMSVQSKIKFSPEKQTPVTGSDPGKAKAWLHYDRPSSTVYSSYNVSNVLQISTYGIRVFFEKPFKEGNKLIALALSENVEIQWDRAPSNSGAYIDIYTTTSAGAAVSTNLNLVCFGELFDE